MDELALHPTVKPVPMIAHAIKDVSRRGCVILDLFGGSRSTLIAAHKTGRRARLCELNPVYCDRPLARWESFAKDDAEHIACGLSQGGPDAEVIGTTKIARPQSADTVSDEGGFSGTILVFRSKRADRLKILAWDGSGLILCWPANREPVVGSSPIP